MGKAIDRPRKSGKMEEQALSLFPQLESAQSVQSVPSADASSPKFTFIDLFAGIGGFRLALESLGGRCVFTSEWDKNAQKTYVANFGEQPYGDITSEEVKACIPKAFDVLCAGFPCQPFSIAGVSKKKSLGRETGFLDKAQGTLFFDVATILERHRPKGFILENVKNLVSHDKGNTFRVIEETLRALDYSVHYRVMDGQHFTPQHRERIFIVGVDLQRYGDVPEFAFPKLGPTETRLRDILEPEVSEQYTLSDKLWSYLQAHAAKHRAKGNGFGYGLANLDGVSRTLSARYYKDGSEILIPQEGQNPRKLTPRECARLMGYPEDFVIDAVGRTSMYKQFGNSVVVPLVRAIAEAFVSYLQGLEEYGAERVSLVVPQAHISSFAPSQRSARLRSIP